MAYRIIWSPTARRKLQDTLPEAVASAVWEFATGPLAANPQRVGKALRLDLAGLWSARRGEYRIVFRVDEEAQVVEIADIGHRRSVYRPR